MVVPATNDLIMAQFHVWLEHALNGNSAPIALLSAFLRRPKLSELHQQ
jgi:hypothetical protein